MLRRIFAVVGLISMSSANLDLHWLEQTYTPAIRSLFSDGTNYPHDAAPLKALFDENAVVCVFGNNCGSVDKLDELAESVHTSYHNSFNAHFLPYHIAYEFSTVATKHDCQEFLEGIVSMMINNDSKIVRWMAIPRDMQAHVTSRNNLKNCIANDIPFPVPTGYLAGQDYFVMLEKAWTRLFETKNHDPTLLLDSFADGATFCLNGICNTPARTVDKFRLSVDFQRSRTSGEVSGPGYTYREWHSFTMKNECESWVDGKTIQLLDSNGKVVFEDGWVVDLESLNKLAAVVACSKEDDPKKGRQGRARRRTRKRSRRRGRGSRRTWKGGHRSSD